MQGPHHVAQFVFKFAGLVAGGLRPLNAARRVLPGDEDIGRLEFAVNHSFLVGVLDGLADLDEQIQSRACRQVKLIAEVRDPGTPHEFHHEKRPSRFGCAGIEDLRDGIAQVPRQAAEQPVGGVRHLPTRLPGWPTSGQAESIVDRPHDGSLHRTTHSQRAVASGFGAYFLIMIKRSRKYLSPGCASLANQK